jgi:hypothetical protein
MKTITRNEAKAAGLTLYFTGQPCKYGHVSERRTVNTACVECHRQSARKYGEKNASEIADKRKTSNLTVAQREAKAASAKAYYVKNRARLLDSFAEYYADNKPDFIARAAEREAAVTRATPKWLNATHRRTMKIIYEACERLTNMTGVKHHVDHIVPLRGKNVCGLHVPWNLQVITAEANIRKGNKHNV